MGLISANYIPCVYGEGCRNVTLNHDLMGQTIKSGFDFFNFWIHWFSSHARVSGHLTSTYYLLTTVHMMLA